MVRKTCYACHRPATTSEHAPPRSFFPPLHRVNLITVPSCPHHNNENSKDVEYARNVLVSATRLETHSAPVFAKMMRSIDRRPSVIDWTFPDLREVRYQGEDTGAFSVDLRRFNRIMSAIAQALYFRETGKKRKFWEILCPNLQSDASLSGRPDAFEPLRRKLATFDYEYQVTGQPSVFVYGRTRMESRGFIYQFVFYDAVIVNAWPSRRQIR